MRYKSFEMKIATYNVNGINVRLPVLLRWLELAELDVLCLQELKAPTEKFPEEAILEAGYNAVWHGQKSWNGVAILTRGLTIEEVARGLPADFEDIQSRYIEALVDGIRICCLYVPNVNPSPGAKFDYKLRWLDGLLIKTSKLLALKEPVVLAGDFNIIPEEIDVYKPERWVKDALFRQEVRAVYKTLIEQGWTDAVRKTYPLDTIYTFWDYFRNAYQRNAGLRIDHFLLSPELAKKLIGCGVDHEVRDWEKSSDHAPVWIEI